MREVAGVTLCTVTLDAFLGNLVSSRAFGELFLNVRVVFFRAGLLLLCRAGGDGWSGVGRRSGQIC